MNGSGNGNGNGGRVSLSDAVVEKLEAMIATMKPGERLPTEKEL